MDTRSKETRHRPVTAEKASASLVVCAFLVVALMSSCIIYSPSLTPRTYYTVAPYFGAGMFNPMFIVFNSFS